MYVYCILLYMYTTYYYICILYTTICMYTVYYYICILYTTIYVYYILLYMYTVYFTIGECIILQVVLHLKRHKIPHTVCMYACFFKNILSH